MKKNILVIAILAFAMGVSAQGNGIQFEQGLSWQQVLAKAKKENKYILVDCYTTWCGPCKYMAANIFPLKQTGDAINPKFISVGMQLDTTAKDGEFIKASYADGHMIATQYHVRAYPTYLFFNPDGKLVHRALGSTDAAHFISFTEDAMNPDKQYYSMLEKYRQGSKDSAFLETLLVTATDNGEKSLADSLMTDWLSVIKDPYTKDRLMLIAGATSNTDQAGFNLFLHNAARIDHITRPDFAESVVTNVIARNNKEIGAAFTDPVAKPDWDKIYDGMKTSYGADYAHRVLTMVKVPFYKKQKDWSAYCKSVDELVKEYGKDIQPAEFNNYAWDIFQHCTKPDELALGLALSGRSLKTPEKPDPGFMDTYANLLYKSGKTTDAIVKETEAMNLADPSEKPSYQETIAKMKAGQPTW